MLPLGSTGARRLRRGRRRPLPDWTAHRPAGRDPAPGASLVPVPAGRGSTSSSRWPVRRTSTPPARGRSTESGRAGRPRQRVRRPDRRRVRPGGLGTHADRHGADVPDRRLRGARGRDAGTARLPAPAGRPTSRSSCGAPGSPRARCATSASPGCWTRTRSSPARSSPRPATGAPTRRTSTTRSATASRPSSRRSTTSRARSRARTDGADVPAGADPVGYQRVYGTAERPIDVFAEVRTGDVVLVPHGWHGPAMAPPGLRPVLPERDGRARPGAGLADLRRPRHAWVRDTWAGQDVDPRLRAREEAR